ncbi:U3 snoRNP-associated protein Nan1, partial [Schizosaccharomyces japonicus yFS275]
FIIVTYERFAGVFSLVTGECISKIAFPGAKEGLTPVASLLSPSNEFELSVVFNNGLICVYDWSTSTCLRAMDLSTQVYAANFAGSTLYVVAQSAELCEAKAEKNNTESFALYALTASNENGVDVLQPAFVCGVPSFHSFSATQYENATILALTTNDKLLLVFPRQRKKRQVRFDLKEIPFTNQTPELVQLFGNKVAVSDSEGKVIVYQNIQRPKLAAPRVFHWHANPIRGLAWALDGNYLLSGGSEGVLVLWQLETAQRQYLPRLGSSLHAIAVSPNNQQYAVYMGDNSVQVIGTADLNKQVHIRGLAPSSVVRKTGFSMNSSSSAAVTMNLSVVHPTGDLLYLSSSFFNGHSAILQQYSLDTDSTVHCFEVARYSYGNTSKGAMQAIAENALQKNYSLITRVDDPHGFGKPCAEIDYFPLETRLRVSGNGCFLKALEPFSSALTCSADGSLLAYAHDSRVYLVDADSLETVSSFNIPFSGQIENARFVGSEYLVVVAHRRLLVWNVIVGEATWTLDSKFSGLLETAGTDTFAVIDTNSVYSRLLVFRVTSPVIVSMHVIKSKPQALLYSHHSFVVIDSRYVIHLYGRPIAKWAVSASAFSTDARSVLGDFSSALTTSRVTDAAEETVDHAVYKRLTRDKIHNLFDVPSTTEVDMEGMFRDLSRLAVGEPLGQLGVQLVSPSA